ncbi:MAG TPA: patatin-like phospholipase family protein [Steroidobacteraceae bacterium]|jgi:NTE family protein|nr:patatin-like phospholipase family protein [Steroidobacteraceae bacterium]
MGKLGLRLGLSWALLAGCHAAYAEPPAAAPQVRPRICLVLSGGGARGMAHIGVLKVLEELQIPIDCIAGTSMGAVVGGLYASGMTAAQIDATMRTVDWQEAFRDAPPRRDLAFRRKQDDQNFLVRLPLGLKHGKLLLPKGFIQGQKLQETLRQLTLPFSASTEFDLLPTPFRAVATDLVTGKAVLLDKGDLSVAMRASISAPGLFAPVESQGLLLVDGGLAENLPIDVARQMHADVLIVSDVSFPLQPRSALDSALSISNQMLAILVRKDADRQRATLGPADVLIEPTLGEASSTDFTAANSTIAAGENAARSMLARLDALRVGDAAYHDYLVRRAAREPGLPPIEFVRVDQQSKRYEKTILAEMAPLVGKPLDVNAVGRRITDLYGLGNFETLDYALVDQGHGTDEQTGLEVRARRKSWGPNYVRFGLNLEDNFQGNSRYNAAARFILTELDDLGAELVTDVQIGSDPKVASEFYQPLNATRTWFIAPSLRIEARDLQLYDKDDEIADYRDREAEADFDIGRTLGNWGEIRAGYHRTNGAARERLGPPNLVEQQYNDGALFVKFSYDRLDNLHFPREGQTFSFQWLGNRTELGADTPSDKVQADWLAANSIGRNTLLLWTSAGSVVGGNIKPTAVPDLFSLGGFFNLSGLAPTSLFGPNYAIARAIYFRKIGRGGEGFFEFPAYVGMSLETGNTWESRSAISFGSAHKDASLFFAFDTFLGPVYLGSGYDTAGHSAYYLFLGRTF